MNGNLITQEDLIDFYASYDDSIRRSKTRIDIKRELIDDKCSKVRTTNKSRTIKSAPTIRRSKSQLVVTTKQKEGNMNSSRPTSSVISVLYIYIYIYPYLFVSYFFCLTLFRRSFSILIDHENNFYFSEIKY